jgi:hypothetical protein
MEKNNASSLAVNNEIYIFAPARGTLAQLV